MSEATNTRPPDAQFGVTAPVFLAPHSGRPRYRLQRPLWTENPIMHRVTEAVDPTECEWKRSNGGS